MPQPIFNYMAIFNINGPGGTGGWGREPLLITAPLTVQLWANIERAIRERMLPTLPAGCGIVLVNLIPLEV